MKIHLYKISLLLILSAFSCKSYTQASVADSLKIDSLKKVLVTEKDDTNKVNTLNEFSDLLIDKREISLAYSKSAIVLSHKLGFKKGEANAYYNYGLALEGSNYIGTQGAISEVVSNLTQAINLFQAISDNSKIADCYYSISRAYIAIDQNLPEGIANILTALKIYEKTGNKKKIASCYLSLGADYQNENDDSLVREGGDDIKTALKIFTEIKDSSNIAYASHLVGELSIHHGDYDEALHYLNMSLEIYQAMGDRGPDYGIGWTEGSIAEVYEAQGNEAIAAGNKVLASKKLQTALKIFRERVKTETAGGRSHRQSFGELGDCYFALSKITYGATSRENLLQSLNYNNLLLQIARDANNKSIISDAYYNLSQVTSALGNYKDAFGYYESYIVYRDSLYNDENTRKTERTLMQYNFDKKTELAKSVQDKKDADAKRLKNQQLFIIAALGIIVLAVIVIALIQFRNNRQKQKANKLLQNQKTEIQQQKDKVELTLTKLKSTQAQLIQSEKMASLGEVTAGIAHEIQNPLNFVNNFSEVNKELLVEMKEEMNRGNIDDANTIANDIIDNEQKIIHHGKRADAIVKNMLQHSRTSTGQKEPTDINALADEYLRLSYHGIRAKDKAFNANMQTDFDDNIGKINIIPQEIGRVLLNLYNNAFYAVTEKKKQQGEGYEPTVSVSSKKTGGNMVLTVKDNGNGISQKIVDKIFQPFFTTKPTGEGTGLGLSLSYDIIKAHGGEIKVESKESGGSEFIILLSLNQEQ